MGRPSSIKVGDIYSTNNCGDVKVLEYHNYANIVVIFLDKGITKTVRTASLKSGSISYKNNYYNEGSIFIIDRYTTVKVINYKDYDHVFVSILGYEDVVCLPSSIGNLIKGQFKNPFKPCFAGVGFIGLVPPKTVTSSDKPVNKSYTTWGNMMTRCYDINNCNKGAWTNYGGKGITICDKWKDFSIFKEWYDRQPNRYNTLCNIDKDLKNLSGTEYSPENCTLLYNKINILFAINGNKFSTKNGDLPMGVVLEEGFAKYRASCLISGKRYSFSTVSQCVDFKAESYRKRLQLLLKESNDLGLYIDPVVLHNLLNMDFRSLLIERKLSSQK